MSQQERVTSITGAAIKRSGVNPFTIGSERNPSIKSKLTEKWLTALQEDSSIIPTIEDLTLTIEHFTLNRQLQRDAKGWNQLAKALALPTASNPEKPPVAKTLELNEETWPLLIRFRNGINILLSKLDQSNLPTNTIVLHAYVGRLIDAKEQGVKLPAVLRLDTNLELNSLPVFSDGQEEVSVPDTKQEGDVETDMAILRRRLELAERNLRRSLARTTSSYSSRLSAVTAFTAKQTSLENAVRMFGQTFSEEFVSPTATERVAEIFNQNGERLEPAFQIKFWLEVGSDPLLVQLLNFSIGSVLEEEEGIKFDKQDHDYQPSAELVEFLTQALGGEKEIDNDTVLFLEMLEEPILKKLGLFAFCYQMRDWNRLEYFQKGPGLISQLTDYWRGLAQLTGKQYFSILADSLKEDEAMLQTSDEEMVWREYLGNLKVDENTGLANPELAEAVHTRLQNRFVRAWLWDQAGMGVFNTQIDNLHAEVFVKQEDMGVGIVATLNDNDGRRVMATLTSQFRLQLPERVMLEFPDAALWFEKQLLTSVFKFLGQIRELGRENYRQGFDRRWDDEQPVRQVFPEEREEEKREPVSAESAPTVLWGKHSLSDLAGINSKDQQIIMNRLFTLIQGSGRIRMLKQGFGLKEKVARLVVGKYRIAFREVEGGLQILGVFSHGDNNAYVRELARRLA